MMKIVLKLFICFAVVFSCSGIINGLDVCPIYSPQECTEFTNHECLADTDCGDNKKCCFDGCQLVCAGINKTKAKEVCSVPVDLGFLIVASGSIGAVNFQKILIFVTKIVGAFDISEEGTHVGVIYYSNDAVVAFDFNKFKGEALNKEAIVKEINKISVTEGQTRIDLALQEAKRSLFGESGGMRPDKPKIALVMTDGQQTKGKLAPDAVDLHNASRPLKDLGVQIYSLGIGKDIAMGELLDIASDDKFVFRSADFDELVSIVANITEQTCKGCIFNGKFYETGNLRWEECNSCTCGEDGNWFCTIIGCPTGVCYYNGQEYKDGQTFQNDCNTCTCSANNANEVGYVGCTEVGCPSKCQFKGKVYDEGSVRYEDCNPCSCAPNGEWLCTTIKCPTGFCYHNGKKYQDGQTFKKDCNSCFCAAKKADRMGTVRCTLKECLSKSFCFEEREKWKTSPIGIPPPGAFVPKCNPDGSYTDLQCHASNNECWCVDPASGKEKPGTRTKRGQPKPICNCVIPCPKIYKLVCGTNGKAYANDCELKNAQCKDKSLFKTHDFICEDDISSRSEQITLKGKILLPPNFLQTMPKGSCLHVMILEEFSCQGSDCGVPAFSSILIRDPKVLADGSIPYKLQVRKIESSYMVTAALKMGWCEKENSLKAGDYSCDKLYFFSAPEDGSLEVIQDMFLIENKITSLSEKAGDNITVKGNIVFSPTIPAVLPKGSCLTVKVLEERLCEGGYEDCDVPILSSTQQEDPKLLPGYVIPYQLSVKKLEVPYIIEASLSMGWCRGPEDSIKAGDYFHDLAYSFSAPEDGSLEVTKDISLIGYKIVHSGYEKKCAKVCPFIYLPVCSSDGRTLDNECLFEIEKCKKPSLEVAHQGPCRECPKDVPIVNCLVNPCDTATCPSSPDAECRANYCGGCNAEFFKRGRKVTCARRFALKVGVRAFVTSDGDHPCPSVCPALYNPICGSDRKTHSSECHLKLEACTTRSTIFKMHNGPCGYCKKHCNRRSNPKCGSDGLTYGNRCELDRVICKSGGKVNFAYDGSCDKPRCRPICPAIYAPQCGSDGVTYSSLCVLQAKSCATDGKVKFSYPGKCRVCSSICTREYDPYCGTDGQTHGNNCMMNYVICKSGGRVQLKYKGECEKPSCPIKCPRRHIGSVCGTDGKVYRSLCKLQKKTCQTNGQVYLRHFGDCEKRCQRFRTCTYEYNPQCGTNGKTYSNMCSLRGAMCRSNGAVRRAHGGECGECPKGVPIVGCKSDPCQQAYCPKYPRAVCRANFCGGCNAQFFNRGKKIEDCGTTCSAACTKEFFPQCGSDGKTYSNRCLLAYAKCQSKGKVWLLYSGQCIQFCDCPVLKEGERCVLEWKPSDNYQRLFRKVRAHYDNGWHTGTIQWYNSRLDEYRILFPDGTDDYVKLDDFDGIEMILL